MRPLPQILFPSSGTKSLHWDAVSFEGVRHRDDSQPKEFLRLQERSGFHAIDSTNGV